MKERGLIFSGPMVRATNDGRKTQTRRTRGLNRINENPDDWTLLSFDKALGIARFQWHVSVKCPYGVVGDKLYVKETHYRYGKWIKNGRTKTGKQAWRFKPNDRWAERNFGVPFLYWDCPPKDVYRNSYRKEGWYKRSALFMPKKFTRIWLEITDIRVERVQQISRADIRAEGILEPHACHSRRRSTCAKIAKAKWIRLWDSINAKRGYGWEINPWVWAIAFRKL